MGAILHVKSGGAILHRCEKVNNGHGEGRRGYVEGGAFGR